MDYTVVKANLLGLKDSLAVAEILCKCGRDMKEKYGLLHWDNSLLKTWLIIYYTAVKNRVFIVYDRDRSPVATFQVGVFDDYLHFGKLAVLPEFSGNGVGKFCVEHIGRIAKESGKNRICCEVYEKSEHALGFYKKLGFEVTRRVSTRKYTELALSKNL